MFEDFSESAEFNCLSVLPSHLFVDIGDGHVLALALLIHDVYCFLDDASELVVLALTFALFALGPFVSCEQSKTFDREVHQFNRLVHVLLIDFFSERKLCHGL